MRSTCRRVFGGEAGEGLFKPLKLKIKHNKLAWLQNARNPILEDLNLKIFQERVSPYPLKGIVLGAQYNDYLSKNSVSVPD